MTLRIQENIPLNTNTTLKIGGVARYFVEVANKEEVIEVALFAKEKELPILILGGGSNLLISDEGYYGVVIKNAIKGVVFEEKEGEVLMHGGSGEVFDEVVALAIEKGYGGLENLSSIPGTLGATPVQNVGAYGTEISELIESVTAINLDTQEEKVFAKSECYFNYRDSFFKSANGKKYFIISVSLRLNKNWEPKIKYADLLRHFTDKKPTLIEVRNAVIEIRAGKFPDWRVLGTAGSFFKNPIIEREHYERLVSVYDGLPHYDMGDDMVKIPLGYVLDKLCGLKGYRPGKVGLYKEQALVLVNYGGATAMDVKEFVSEITVKVYQKTKIKIEPEVNFV